MNQPGQINSIRFYKGAGDSGYSPRIGKIWNSTGTLITSVTFTNTCPADERGNVLHHHEPVVLPERGAHMARAHVAAAAVRAGYGRLLIGIHQPTSFFAAATM